MEEISGDVRITRINGSVSRGGWECNFTTLSDTDAVEVNQRVAVTWRGAFGSGPGILRPAFDGYVLPTRFQFDAAGSQAEFVAQTSDGYLRRGWVQGIGFAEIDARTHYHQFSDDATECPAEPMGYDMTMGKLVKHILGYYDECCDLGGPQPPWCLEYNATTTDVNCGSHATLDNLPTAAHLCYDGWFQADGWGEANAGYMISKEIVFVGGWYVQLNQILGGIRISISCAGVVALSIVAFTPDSAWHHIAVRYDDAGDRKVYIALDGVWSTAYITQNAGVGAYNSDATGDLHLGNDAAVAKTFDGNLGWQRLSSNARFTAGVDFSPPPRCIMPTRDANTVALWIYEGAGNTIHDYQAATGDRDGTAVNHVWDCDCGVWVAHTNMVHHPTANPNGWISLDNVEITPFDAAANPDGTMAVRRYIVRETDNLWERLKEIAKNEFFVIYFDKTDTLYYMKHPMYRSVVPPPVMTFTKEFSVTPPVVEPRHAKQVRQVRLHAVTDEGDVLHSEYPASPTHVYGKVQEVSRIRCNAQATLDDWCQRYYLWLNREYTVRWPAPGLCGLLFEILDRVSVTYTGTSANGVHVDWSEKKFWIHEITVLPGEGFGGRTEFVLEAESL
jgi:hypothetical protein